MRGTCGQRFSFFQWLNLTPFAEAYCNHPGGDWYRSPQSNRQREYHGSRHAKPRRPGEVWNTTGTPTLTDDSTDERAVRSTGAFTSTIAELSPNTTYYVRAHATNARVHPMAAK